MPRPDQQIRESEDAQARPEASPKRSLKSGARVAMREPSPFVATSSPNPSQSASDMAVPNEGLSPSDTGGLADAVPMQAKDREAKALPSEDGLRQYRLALAREARRFKRYPAYARERGWQGDVVILLAASPLMETPMISLEKASGHSLLDDQALDIVRRAASQAALPEALRGKRFQIAIPIQFRLDE